MTYSSLPNIPWEERPAGCSDVVWRYSANPIIPRNLIPSAEQHFQQRGGALPGQICRCLPL